MYDGTNPRRLLAAVTLVLGLALSTGSGRAIAQTPAAPTADQSPPSVVPPIKRVAPKTPPLPDAVAKSAKGAKSLKTAKVDKTGKSAKTGKPTAVEDASRCAPGKKHDAIQKHCIKGGAPVASPVRTKSKPKTAPPQPKKP